MSLPSLVYLNPHTDMYSTTFSELLRPFCEKKWRKKSVPQVTRIHSTNFLSHCNNHLLTETVLGDLHQCHDINPLTPNDHYRGHTAPLTSKRCILYIYSTNISTEYFKHGIYSPFFSLQNAVCFIILTYLVPVLFTFYIRGVLKLKK